MTKNEASDVITPTVFTGNMKYEHCTCISEELLAAAAAPVMCPSSPGMYQLCDVISSLESHHSQFVLCTATGPHNSITYGIQTVRWITTPKILLGTGNIAAAVVVQVMVNASRLTVYMSRHMTCNWKLIRRS